MGKGKGHFCFRCRSFFSFFKEEKCVFGVFCVWGSVFVLFVCLFLRERDETRCAREKRAGGEQARTAFSSLSLSLPLLSLPLFSIHPSIPPRAPFLSCHPAQEEREKDINKQERTRGVKKIPEVREKLNPGTSARFC